MLLADARHLKEQAAASQYQLQRHPRLRSCGSRLHANVGPSESGRTRVTCGRANRRDGVSDLRSQVLEYPSGRPNTGRCTGNAERVYCEPNG